MSGFRIESVIDVQLYVVQHAEAAPGQGPDVGLTEAGASQAWEAGREIAALGILPDLVMASPSPQTRETCSLALTAMGCDKNQVVDDYLQEVENDWVQNRLRADRFLARLTNPFFRGRANHAVVLAFGHSLWTRQLAGNINAWPAEKIKSCPMPDVSLSLFTYGNEFGDPRKLWRTWYAGKVINQFGVFNEFASRQAQK